MNNIYITFDVCYAESRFRALLTSRMAGISQFWESLILVLDSQHIDEDQRFPETKIYQLLTMIYLNVTHFQNKFFKFKSFLESLIFQSNFWKLCIIWFVCEIKLINLKNFCPLLFVIINLEAKPNKTSLNAQQTKPDNFS